MHWAYISENNIIIVALHKEVRLYSFVHLFIFKLMLYFKLTIYSEEEKNSVTCLFIKGYHDDAADRKLIAHVI